MNPLSKGVKALIDSIQMERELPALHCTNKAAALAIVLRTNKSPPGMHITSVISNENKNAQLRGHRFCETATCILDVFLPWRYRRQQIFAGEIRVGQNSLQHRLASFGEYLTVAIRMQRTRHSWKKKGKFWPSRWRTGHNSDNDSNKSSRWSSALSLNKRVVRCMRNVSSYILLIKHFYMFPFVKFGWGEPWEGERGGAYD